MDRQIWDHGDGQFEIDQLAFDLAITAEGDTPGQRQITVEPRRKQGATVDFDTQLPETLALYLGLRLDPQARAIGMGTDQTDAAAQGR